MPSKAFPEVINHLPLFEGIPPEERDRMLQSGHVRTLSAGEYLFRHGDPVKHFYIVCRGHMQLMRETPDGKEITTDISSRGKTIGKIDILQSFHCHRVSACAVGEVIVLEFEAAWLRDIAAHPVISLNILSSMSQYVHMVEVESEQKSTMSVGQRIGCFLQRLCIMHDLDPRGFTLPYSKSLIASRLGMEPETLSRGLATLKGHGIQVQDSKVTFCDIEAVDEFICGHCSMSEECPTHQKISDSFSSEIDKKPRA